MATRRGPGAARPSGYLRAPGIRGCAQRLRAGGEQRLSAPGQPLDVLSLPHLRGPADREHRQAAGGPGRLGPTADRPQPRVRRAAARGARRRESAGSTRSGGAGNPVRDRLPCVGSGRTPAARRRPRLRPGSMHRQGEQGAAGPPGVAGRGRSGSLPPPRPADAHRSTPRDHDGVRVEVGPTAHADRPLVDRQTMGPSGRAAGRHQPPLAPPQLRHPHARRRRRPARSRRCSGMPRSPRPRSTRGSS